jgi:cell division protein FtsI/penicillin-binding protein 2
MGDELALTIDMDLQMAADSCFGDTLSGAAIFLDPKTGEILALVSKPTYDPNLFPLRFAADYLSLANDERQPLFDRRFVALIRLARPQSCHRGRTEKNHARNSFLLCRAVNGNGSSCWKAVMVV